MPLGALLAARTHRESFVRAFVVGFTFGLFLEMGQAFLPDRSADISDAISAGAGTVVGLALWSGSRFGGGANGHVRARWEQPGIAWVGLPVQGVDRVADPRPASIV
jgi:hypothetical protein